jgi:hypothetical protein
MCDVSHRQCAADRQHQPVIKPFVDWKWLKSGMAGRLAAVKSSEWNSTSDQRRHGFLCIDVSS